MLPLLFFHLRIIAHETILWTIKYMSASVYCILRIKGIGQTYPFG